MATLLRSLRTLVFSALALVLLSALPGCPFQLPKSPLTEIVPADIGDDAPLTSDVVSDSTVAVDQSVEEDLWWLTDADTRDTTSPFDVQWPDTPSDFSADFDTQATTWSCEHPVDFFTNEVHNRSFLATDQTVLVQFDDKANQDRVNWLAVSYGYCGADLGVASGAEGVQAFDVDYFTPFHAEIHCSHDCYAYLFQNGCQYNDLIECWWDQGDTVSVDADLLPGRYLLAVEFPYVEGVEPSEYRYDIHASINHVQPDAGCATESVTNISQIADACSSDGTPAVSIDSELAVSDVDDFYFTCNPLGTPVDSIGGMPDAVHSFYVNQSLGSSTTLSVTVEFEGWTPAQGAGHILAVTGGSCGGEDFVVDCVAGSEASLTVSGITAFAGETLYAVVDGMGADRFDFDAPLHYTMTWTVEEGCP